MNNQSIKMDFKVTKELIFPGEIFDARYHPTKQNLIGGATIAGDVYLYENGELITKLKRHHKGSSVRRVRFDKDGRMVTIAKTVKLHDLDTNKNIHTLKRNNNEKVAFYSVAILSNNIICAGDDCGCVFVWDTRTPEEPVFKSHDCEQYISGIDGRYEGRRMFVCTSGEGTLTAYDLRASKMFEPQSELFEAGFQCVQLVDSNKKVVIGGEDGAVYVFNQGEWAHTSGKFAFCDDTHNRGKCSIEGLDLLTDGSTFVTACSDGRLRAVSLWPHKLIRTKSVCKRNSLDTIQVSPHDDGSEILVGGDRYINLLSYEYKSDDENDDSSSTGESFGDDSPDEGDERSANAKLCKQTDSENSKKLKADTEDYLEIFK